MKKDNLRRLSTPFKLIPVQRSVASAGPSAAQIQKAVQYFNKCENRLSDVISDPRKIVTSDENNLVKQRGNTRNAVPILPEVMILGRSNVGKSSLITALMSPLNVHDGGNTNSNIVKEFARSSVKAGFTQSLNFYNCGRKLRIIDTPGYGHGSVQGHGNLVLNYLREQKNLKRVYVLVDGYTGISPLDQDIFNLLAGTGVSWNIVLTKLDKHIRKPGESRKQGSPVKQFVTKEDSETINGVVKKTFDHVRLMSSTPDSEGGNGTVLEEVFGTCAHKRLNYMGIPELRASILSVCGVI